MDLISSPANVEAEEADEDLQRDERDVPEPVNT